MFYKCNVFELQIGDDDGIEDFSAIPTLMRDNIEAVFIAFVRPSNRMIRRRPDCSVYLWQLTSLHEVHVIGPKHYRYLNDSLWYWRIEAYIAARRIQN